MPFELPRLPYAYDALEPAISEATLKFHHDKHHRHYVDTLNDLIKGTPYAALTLEDIILETAGKKDKTEIFNNAGQTWSHTFYWQSMTPEGGGTPSGAVAGLIEQSFGGVEKFNDAFTEAGQTQFGSGWAWLVFDHGALKVTKTPNADLPLAHSQVALLAMDVWEHAYYLDAQNKREDHIEKFLERLVNWEFVNANLAQAQAMTPKKRAAHL